MTCTGRVGVGATVGQRSSTDGERTAAQARQVLCLGDDPDLRAELVAVCQEAGAVVTALASAPSPAQWLTAALVLLDARAHDLSRNLPRRDGVVLVHLDPLGVEPGPDVWRSAVAAGAERVVVLPVARPWLVDAVRQADRPRGRCVATVGARGGAGATSTAVALATAAAQAGHRVLLVDADPLGGGLDLAMGAEGLPGMRWPDLHDVRGPLPPGGLAAALPVADGVRLLSHGRQPVQVEPDAVRAVLRAALDEHDLVVVDLPRTGGGAAQAAALLVDDLVCVCPAEVRAGAAAPAVLAGWPSVGRVHLLVRGPSPGGLRPGEAADAVRVGLGEAAAAGRRLGRVDLVRAEPGLAAALERGEAFAVAVRSPLRRWATRWVGELMAGSARAAA